LATGDLQVEGLAVIEAVGEIVVMVGTEAFLTEVVSGDSYFLFLLFLCCCAIVECAQKVTSFEHEN
jgi:hypothetical protein